MLQLYTMLLYVVEFLLKWIRFLNPKLNQFVVGRLGVFEELKNKISSSDATIWFHAASLGEYEQGLPVMEAIKKLYPNHKIVLTFFSPSGYEVRKNNLIADVTVYLPLDTKVNAQKFIQAIQPKMVFFIKYEYWPNYLNELKNKHIPTYLLSGIFRENQVFFKWYAGFYRKALDAFTHFFVQNESSKQLLFQLQKTNVTVSGDTRFDRVFAIVNKDNSLPFVEDFINNTTTIVAGSTWLKDEELLVDFINKCDEDVKFIIAPHNIKPEMIIELQKSIVKKTVLFSEKDSKNLSEYDVLIVDTVGILTAIYSYADIAYVGGGFGQPGVHNVLEPAAFGLPIVIGSNYSRFAEAVALVHFGGCKVINDTKDMADIFAELISNKVIRDEIGHASKSFVTMNIGATKTVLENIKRNRQEVFI